MDTNSSPSNEPVVMFDIRHLTVEELARLCRRGPRMAQVSSISEDLADAPAEPGFHCVASE